MTVLAPGQVTGTWEFEGGSAGEASAKLDMMIECLEDGVEFIDDVALGLLIEQRCNEEGTPMGPVTHKYTATLTVVRGDWRTCDCGEEHDEDD